MQPSDKIKRVVCRHWVFNECHKGNACTYKHEWDLENMPECEYGDHCTRASCPLKHPPKSEDVNLFVGSDFVERMLILQTRFLSSWKKM